MEIIGYTSSVAPEVGGNDIFEIVSESSRNNVLINVSGVLLFNQHRFLQVLEGERDDLETLLTKIAQDNRHSRMKIHGRLPIEQRLFGRWRMKRLRSSMLDNESMTIHKQLGRLKFTEDWANEVERFYDERLKQAA
jgi:hypothetical protein